MPRGRRRSRRRPRKPWWADLEQDELLDVRLCDLELSLEHSALADRVERLWLELERKGFRFRPHVWLSNDWFTPDGVTGFAIPFFLAHPRLCALEHRMMFEVEGGAHPWCMRLLRHEAAHAIDNAYRLHHRKRWRDTFGRFSTPYLSSYAPNPSSRHYVQNLGYWYAQSHPCEDFAETFAVWLQPGSRWRTGYAGWPALTKLEYVDELMEDIADLPPKLRSRRTPDSLPRLRTTLREYYEAKQANYRVDGSFDHDELLDRVFTRRGGRPTAATFLRRNRTHLRQRIASQTGSPRYVVDQAINIVIVRCKQRGLRLQRSDAESLVDTAILLTTMTAGFLVGTRPHYLR